MCLLNYLSKLKTNLPFGIYNKIKIVFKRFCLQLTVV